MDLCTKGYFIKLLHSNHKYFRKYQPQADFTEQWIAQCVGKPWLLNYANSSLGYTMHWRINYQKSQNVEWKLENTTPINAIGSVKSGLLHTRHPVDSATLPLEKILSDIWWGRDIGIVKFYI